MMKTINTTSSIVGIVLVHMVTGCSHVRPPTAWVSPTYDPPPFHVLSYSQVSNKIVRVLDRPGDPCLHIKTTDGDILEREIDIDPAVKKYPELSIMFPENDDPVVQHIIRQESIRRMHKGFYRKSAQTRRCPITGLRILCLVDVWDWTVTVLDGDPDRRYNVQQCGAVVATSLQELEMAGLFPELADVPRNTESQEQNDR